MYFKIENKKIFYRIIGKGKPLLFFHGGLGLDHTYFYNDFKELSKDFKLIFFDLGGNGRSYRTVSNFSVEMICRDAYHLVSHLIKEKCNVIGHSYGGFLAILFCLMFPKIVDKVISISGTLMTDLINKKKNKLAKKKLGNRSNILKREIKNNKDFKKYYEHILPCRKIRKYSLGNIFQNDLIEVYNSKKREQLINTNNYEKCSKCAYVYYCRGCPAVSESINGSLFKSDPQCWVNV